MIVWSVVEGAHHSISRYRQRLHATAASAYLDGLNRLRKQLLRLRRETPGIPSHLVEGGASGLLRRTNMLLRQLEGGVQVPPAWPQRHPMRQTGPPSLHEAVAAVLEDFAEWADDQGTAVYVDCKPICTDQWMPHTAVIPQLQSWLSRRAVIERELKPEDMCAYYGFACWHSHLGLRNKQDELALLLAELPGELQALGHRFFIHWESCSHNSHGDSLKILLPVLPTPLALSLFVHVVKPTRKRGRQLPPIIHQHPSS